MKTLFLTAAAVAAVAAVPVLAQTEVVEKHKIVMKSVTRADMIRKVQDHFARMDSDKDGFVTKAEAASGKDKMREHVVERMEVHADKMFDRMDADKDGSISRAEFDSVHEKRVEKVRDGDHRMKQVHIVRKSMHGKLFETADADSDGRVSLQEATSAAAAHFDKMDSNRDGTISADEMRATHQAHMGKPGA